MPDLVRELKDKGTLIYLVDHRNNERLVFQNMKA